VISGTGKLLRFSSVARDVSQEVLIVAPHSALESDTDQHVHD
jgi:hypothetical protein